MLQRKNFAVIIAAITGVVFGAVTTIEGAVGRTVGGITASLLENSFAGIIAIPLITVMFMRGALNWNTARPVLLPSAVAGLLVLVAVAGISYAMPRVGVTAGNMSLVFGQMAIAVLIDTMGVAGYEKVQLTFPRITGLLLMAVGVYLVLPRQS